MSPEGRFTVRQVLQTSTQYSQRYSLFIWWPSFVFVPTVPEEFCFRAVRVCVCVIHTTRYTKFANTVPRKACGNFSLNLRLRHKNEPRFWGRKVKGHSETWPNKMTLTYSARYVTCLSEKNKLVRRFSKCSFDVKVMLFRSYCVCLYDTALWSVYNAGTISKLAACYNRYIKTLVLHDVTVSLGFYLTLVCQVLILSCITVRLFLCVLRWTVLIALFHTSGEF